MSLTLGCSKGAISVCSCSYGVTIERPEHGEGAFGEGTGTGTGTGVLYYTDVPLTCTCVHEYINCTGSCRFHGTERGLPGGDADRCAGYSRHECRSMMFDI